jgi:flagellar biosynthesis/type III secretory pathway protein FliH
MRRASSMAEKVVGRAVEIAPEAMGDIAAQALAAARAHSGRLVLRVHPEDLAPIERERPRWSADLARDANVRVVPDPDVGRCGCVVETPFGRLDARLSTQLDALMRVLRPEPRPKE